MAVDLDACRDCDGCRCHLTRTEVPFVPMAHAISLSDVVMQQRYVWRCEPACDCRGCPCG